MLYLYHWEPWEIYLRPSRLYMINDGNSFRSSDRPADKRLMRLWTWFQVTQAVWKNQLPEGGRKQTTYTQSSIPKVITEREKNAETRKSDFDENIDRNNFVFPEVSASGSRPDSFECFYSKQRINKQTNQILLFVTISSRSETRHKRETEKGQHWHDELYCKLILMNNLLSKNLNRFVAFSAVLFLGSSRVWIPSCQQGKRLQIFYLLWNAQELCCK